MKNIEKMGIHNNSNITRVFLLVKIDEFEIEYDTSPLILDPSLK